MKYIVFLLLFGAGLLFVLKTDAVVGITGRVNWAERNLGGAGTHTFYKLLGVVFLFLSLMLITGLAERLTVGAAGGFFGNLQSGQ